MTQEKFATWLAALPVTKGASLVAVADAALTHDHDAHAHGHGGGSDKSVWPRGSWVRAIWVSVVLPASRSASRWAIRGGLRLRRDLEAPRSRPPSA